MRALVFTCSAILSCQGSSHSRCSILSNVRRWVLKPLKLCSARWRPFGPSNEKCLSRERSWNIILAGGVLKVWFRGEISTQDILSSLLRILKASAVKILMETYVFRVPSRAIAELLNDYVSIFHHQVKSSIWMGCKGRQDRIDRFLLSFPQTSGMKRSLFRIFRVGKNPSGSSLFSKDGLLTLKPQHNY